MWGTCVDLIPAYLHHWRTLAEVDSIKSEKCQHVCMNVNLSGFRVPIASRIHIWWQWLWDRICVGYLCGLDSGMSPSFQHFCGRWEHKGGSKQEYNREVHCLLGAYFYTSTRMLIVVVRRNMRGVSVWSSRVRISVIQAGWRPIDMWNMWNVIF